MKDSVFDFVFILVLLYINIIKNLKHKAGAWSKAYLFWGNEED